MFRSVSLVTLFCLAACALPAGEVIDYLKGYEGRWVGDYTIHSAATGYTETFPLEQRYWWEDGQLHGFSVSETDRGIETASSRAFIQDGKLRLEVTRKEEVEGYWGVLHDGGIVWLTEDLARAMDYQMKETFVEENGTRSLHTDGFDTFVYEGGLAHLVYRGRLRWRPAEDD